MKLRWSLFCLVKGEWLPLRLLDSYAIVLLAMSVSKYVLAMYVSMYAYAAGGR